MGNDRDSKVLPNQLRVGGGQEMLQQKLEPSGETYQTSLRPMDEEPCMMGPQRFQFTSTLPIFFDHQRIAPFGGFSSFPNGNHYHCYCYSTQNIGRCLSEQSSLDPNSHDHENLRLAGSNNYLVCANRTHPNWLSLGSRTDPFQESSMPLLSGSHISSLSTQFGQSVPLNSQQPSVCVNSNICPLHRPITDWGQWKDYHWPSSAGADALEHVDPRIIAPRPSYPSLPLPVSEWSQCTMDDDNWSDFQTNSGGSPSSQALDTGQISVEEKQSSSTSDIPSVGGAPLRWKCSSEPLSGESGSVGDRALEDEKGHNKGSVEWRILPSTPGEASTRDGNSTTSPHPETHVNLVGRATMHYRPKDDLLIEGKNAGLSYKEIRRRYSFTEAESTLRGRYRCLTKAKEERVRRPVWQEKDVELLRQAVNHVSHGSSNKARAIASTRASATGARLGSSRPINQYRMRNAECRNIQLQKRQVSPKIAWSKVAAYIVEQGGSYHFGNAACHKKWVEINESK